MTALTVPARPEEGARLRPLPWRRMAWVTWRQHRFSLGGVTVLLGALAVYLWLTGLQLHHAYATACHPAGSLACASSVAYVTGGTYRPMCMNVPAMPFQRHGWDIRAVRPGAESAGNHSKAVITAAKGRAIRGLRMDG